MYIQNQIKRTLSKPETVEYIRKLLESKEFVNRTQLAGFLCEHCKFHDGRGNQQLSGCLKALRELEAAGRFTLPLAQKQPGRSSPRRLDEAVEEPKQVPGKAGAIRDLQIILVCTDEHMRIWNELMIREHPRGAGPLVGRQLRYLIGSYHGWLGALGFAAPALQLRDRDRWIGWTLEQRREKLHYLVCLSRFLIRPGVVCQNLGSRILGLSVSKLVEDFTVRYGYSPLLVESFVDTTRFLGTCYKAANWIHIGHTQGRGRQDRDRKAEESIKEIYVYPLRKDFRHQMDLAAEAGLGALRPTEGLLSADWANKEFSGAPLGDTRLSNRLVEIAGLKAGNPGLTFPGVSGGDAAVVKGYYRFIDKPNDSAIDMENILLPHRLRTIRRMGGQRRVLCVQDGTDLNYASLSECEGLGVIGTNQTSSTTRGLHMHSTLALSDSGLPLGVLRADCIARKPKTTRSNQRTVPIEQKDTFCWIEGLQDCMEVSAGMPHTQLVCVCDRGADFFELFDEQQRNPCVDLLIRAKHNRTITAEAETTEKYKLFTMMRAAPIQSEVKIEVPRQSARAKRGSQKARPKRPQRTANLSLRYRSVQFQPSQYLTDKKPIEVWVIHALEKAPPSGMKAIEWFLLTTVEITSTEKAVECLNWYSLRWRIEDWHRVLKTGCHIEEYAHRSAERLKRAVAIDLVIAWRIMLMTLLGREAPELPAEVLFTDLEIKVIDAYVKKND